MDLVHTKKKLQIIPPKRAHFATLILKKMAPNLPSLVRSLIQENVYNVRNVWKIDAVSVAEIIHTSKDSKIKKCRFVIHVMMKAKI